MTISLNVSIAPATITAFIAELVAIRIPQLDRIEAALAQLITQEKQLMIDVTALIAAVAQETTVEKSAVVLIQSQSTTLASLSTQLAAAIANNDPVAMAAVQKSIDDAKAALDANNAELATAVAAGTPAAPAV